MMEWFKNWIKKAGIRALKTFAQTMLANITVGMAIDEIKWWHILSVSIVALIYSLLTSIKGIPELDNPDVVGDIVIDPETSNAIIEFTPENGANLELGSTVAFNVTGFKPEISEDAEEGDEDE